MNKKALIIGVSGQDGSYLAKFLLQKGYKVIGASRDAMLSSFSNLSYLGLAGEVELESVSLNDFRSVLQILKKCKPDEVYNLAGQTSVGLSFEMPVETFESISVGVLNLLEAIRFLDRPMRLYNASSSECFGNTEGHPATENTSFKPRSPYAVAKAAAFWQVSNYREAYGMYACSGILFNHESVLRPERFVTKKIVKTACRIAAGIENKLRLGNISVQRDWGWAPEYVEAMWMMLQQDKSDDYVIATGLTSSLQNFVEEVFKRLDMDWREYVEHNPQLIRPTDIQLSCADPEKANQQLGWKAHHTMPDVVRMMVEEELVTGIF